ncbi:hypothetical protein BGZ52_005311, partial [Haplosporangium bisporale]
MADRALLTLLNTNIDKLNSLATDTTPGDPVIYSAIDCIPDEDSADAGHYTPEFFQHSCSKWPAPIPAQAQ